MQEFKNRVAVVTGAASGIGRAIAGRCAAEGMRVVLADSEEGPLHEAAKSMDGIHIPADLGYVGVEGIDPVPIKRRPGQEPHEKAKQDNRVLSSIRAAVERAVAHVKTWRMLSEEGGRFRPPIKKFPEMLAAARGLINLKRRMIMAYE